jgi:hypothetical protein
MQEAVLGFVGAPFVHDVFLSYSHGDVDGTGLSKLKQWSQAFAKELESEFRAHPQFGRDFSLFLDDHHRPEQSLDPMAPLTAQLQTDIEQAAILAVLMSPHYLRSKWCEDERNWWCDKQRQLGLEVDGRVAIARIWPTTESWPDNLTDARHQELIGFGFYDKEQADLLPQPYEWPEPGPQSRDPFRKELLTMVGWLGLKLVEMKKRLDEQKQSDAATARLKATGGQVIYLHGRAGEAASWEKTVTALSGSGLTVLPSEPDPVSSDARTLQDIRQRRVEIMSGCDALLLMTSADGRSVDADLVVVGRQDRNSARAVSNQPLPCALLDCAGAVIATPQRKVAARSLNVEWIDATVDPWTPNVQRWLQTSADGSTGS